MKTLRILFVYAFLLTAAASFVATPVMMVGCKSSPSRQTHTTLHSIGKAVDMAEREYIDRVLTKKTGTNDFPRIQAGYDAFQQALRVAVAAARHDTNALAPANLSAMASALITEIQIAKGK